jgi:hypothetical protein
MFSFVDRSPEDTASAAPTRFAFLTRRLPGSRTRGILPFALFAAVQLADAALTATGVSRFGPSIEANPLVASYIAAYGLIAGLCAVKAVALSAGTILLATAQHFALALLTVLFVFGALVPWALTLAAL